MLARTSNAVLDDTTEATRLVSLDECVVDTHTGQATAQQRVNTQAPQQDLEVGSEECRVVSLPDPLASADG